MFKRLHNSSYVAFPDLLILSYSHSISAINCNIRFICMLPPMLLVSYTRVLLLRLYLFLLLLFLNALAFIFSVTRSFSLPEFSFFSPLGHVSPCSHGQYSAVVLRRSAQSRSSRFGRAALFCVAWVCANARAIRSSSMRGLALRYPRPSSLHVRDVQ